MRATIQRLSLAAFGAAALLALPPPAGRAGEHAAQHRGAPPPVLAPIQRFVYSPFPYNDVALPPQPPGSLLPTGALGCRKAADCANVSGRGAVCDMTEDAFTPGDCNDTVCFSHVRIGYCRDACHSDDDCPDGYACEDMLDPENRGWSGCVVD